MMFEKVQEILSRQFNVAKDKIQLDTVLTNDLGANSLDLVDLLTLLEDEFNIVIPEEEIPKFVKVSEIVAFLERVEKQDKK